MPNIGGFLIYILAVTSGEVLDRKYVNPEMLNEQCVCVCVCEMER